MRRRHMMKLQPWVLVPLAGLGGSSFRNQTTFKDLMKLTEMIAVRGVVNEHAWRFAFSLCFYFQLRFRRFGEVFQKLALVCLVCLEYLYLGVCLYLSRRAGVLYVSSVILVIKPI